MTDIITMGTFEIFPIQRERFISGNLSQEWFDLYPNLFDIDDLRLTVRQAKFGYHFYEWLAAILLFHSTGYFSLIEKYQCHNHHLKQKVIEKINSDTLHQIISPGNRQKSINCPDLLVYAPDFSDWFFCEVKGGKDKVRKDQESAYKTLREITGKPIRLIQFTLAKEF